MFSHTVNSCSTYIQPSSRMLHFSTCLFKGPLCESLICSDWSTLKSLMLHSRAPRMVPFPWVEKLFFRLRVQNVEATWTSKEDVLLLSLRAFKQHVNSCFWYLSVNEAQEIIKWLHYSCFWQKFLTNNPMFTFVCYVLAQAQQLGYKNVLRVAMFRVVFPPWDDISPGYSQPGNIFFRYFRPPCVCLSSASAAETTAVLWAVTLFVISQHSGSPHSLFAEGTLSKYDRVF